MSQRWWVGLLVGVAIFLVAIWFEPTGAVRGWLRGESFFEARPTSHWIECLRSDDPVRASTALESLEQGGAEAVPVLCELLVDQRGTSWNSAEVRCQAAEVLVRIGAPAHSAAPVLLRAIKDPDPMVRSVAATALAAVETPADQAVPALMNLLDEEFQNTRILAARALSVYRADASPALDRLVRLLSDPKLDSELRWNAARTLGKMGPAGEPAISVLVEHLKDETATVREHSAEALGDIGPGAAESVPALIAVLNDPAFRVRRDSARSLGYIGPAAQSAVQPLKKLLDDPEQIVRDAARAAVLAIAPDERLPPEKKK